MKQKIQLIDLPKICDKRGNLSFIESENHIPFKVKRSYWLYDVPGGEIRGGHAFKEQCEFIISMSGSFDVVVDNGIEKKVYNLNRSYYGLYIPKGVWIHIENFSTNSLAMVLASTRYEPKDYIRYYDEFKLYINEEK